MRKALRPAWGQLVVRRVALTATGLLIVSGCGSRERVELLVISEPSQIEAMDSKVRETYRSVRLPTEGKALGLRGDSKLARSFGVLGMWYQAYNQMEPALDCYQNARELNPDDPQWFYLHGVASITEGRAVEGRRSLGRVLEMDPEHHPSRLRLGELLSEMGELESARILFERVLEASPPKSGLHVRALSGLGRNYYLQEEYSLAVVHLDRALEKAPAANALFQPLGMSYRALGQDNRARLWLRRASDLSSERAAVVFEDPWMLEVGNFRQDASFRNFEGKRAMREERFDDAVVAFRRSIAVDPERVGTRVNLAIALQRTGDMDGATEQFEMVLGSEPNHAQANAQLAALFARRGYKDRAEIYCDKALILDPESAKVRMLKITLLRATERIVEIEPHARKLVALEPWNSDYHLLLGRHLARRSLFEEAAEVVRVGMRQVEPESRAEMTRLLERIQQRVVNREP